MFPFNRVNSTIRVINRKGEKERWCRDKIIHRILTLSYNLDMNFIKPEELVDAVEQSAVDQITTYQLDELLAEEAFRRNSSHPDYGRLAARVACSNLHKETKKSFYETSILLSNIIDSNGKPASIWNDEYMQLVEMFQDELDDHLVHSRDYNNYDYLGFATIMRGSLKIHGEPVERPQHILMRSALAIHGQYGLRQGWSKEKILEQVVLYYELMSLGYLCPPSPVIFNAGTKNNQLSSCFLNMTEDSIEGIFDGLKEDAVISKSGGGIGTCVSDVRAKQSYIRGTNGNSNGLLPMLRVFNNVARYVDQGGGKRPGAFAMYLHIWHADIFDFLELKKPQGDPESRCRDLFLGLMACDLFRYRVRNNMMWSLMCPDQCPGLTTTYGEDFEKLYLQYEQEGKVVKQVSASELWKTVMRSIIETSAPYIINCDSMNFRSNQKGPGDIIRCSNLCTEIAQNTSPKETAVCNLLSLNLPKFVDDKGQFNFEQFHQCAKYARRQVDRMIEVSDCPVEKAVYSNKLYRPMALGVQGAAEMFVKCNLPYDSPKASVLDKEIFESLYHGALEDSNEESMETGKTYPKFQSSPLAQGKFQFDLAYEYAQLRRSKEPENTKLYDGAGYLQHSGRYDWEKLRGNIQKYGVMNSLFVGPMPTANSSQVMGNTESFEPFPSCLYVRKTKNGKFLVVCAPLVKKLIELNLWNEDMKRQIIAHRGSVQNITAIPENIRALFPNAWEVDLKLFLLRCRERSGYVDQSMSTNIHMAEPTVKRLSAMYDFINTQCYLKTESYYLRSKPASEPIQITQTLTKVAQKMVSPEPVIPAPIVNSAEQVNTLAVPEPVTSAPSTDEQAAIVSMETCSMEEGCLSCKN